MPPGKSPTADDEKALAERLRAAILAVIESGPVINIDEPARRRLRLILFDAKSAVKGTNETSSEYAMILDHLPFALFTFLQDLSEPHVICANDAERIFVDQFLEAYAHFRRATNELDTYALNKAGEHLTANTFVRYWQLIAYFTVLTAEGHSEEEILRAS